MYSRTSLVTGGTEGIGRAVALRLARGGDRVLIAGRNQTRGLSVLAELKALGGELEHAFIPADLSLLRETAQLVDAVSCYTKRVDAIVCCAGLLSTVPEWTDEGLERNFVLSYLSRYLLVRRLVEHLCRSLSGRLVLVANAGVYPDTLDFTDLQHRRGKPGLEVSARTQFANDLLATELADRLSDTQVQVTCVAPGLTRSGVLRNARGLPGFARVLGPAMLSLFGATPETAAETPAYLAQDARAHDTNGRFFGRKLKPLRVPARALNPERRRQLWEASEELVRPWLPGD